MSVTIHESQMMPAYASDSTARSSFAHGQSAASTPPPPRDSLTNGTAQPMNAKLANGLSTPQSLPNGRSNKPASIDKRLSQEESTLRWSSERPSRDDGYFASVHSTKTKDRLCGSTTHVEMGQIDALDGTREASKDFHIPHVGSVSTAPTSSSPLSQADDGTPNLHIPTNQAHRVSSPPTFNNSNNNNNNNNPGPSQHPYRLQQRHTLEVPKPQSSRARESQNNTDDVVSASGRFSPNTPHRRRGSMSLARRNTRSINSDMPPEDVPQDDEAARWAEHIRQKRASKRKRKEDEDEDRVVVGTKVDQNHVNWVTAYNMLTGIRFTVSRTNAKMDRELTDADFDAKHKFSFDMYVPTGFPCKTKQLLEFSFTSSGEPAFSDFHTILTISQNW
jgi:1-phosphatidylinositol-4-phosphate 5-kinase